MPLMLGHHRGDFGQFGDLVPLRFGIVGRGLIGQGTVTTQAGGGHVADDVVEALGRESLAVSLAVMAGVSRLPSGLASGGAFDHGLGRTRGIGGGRGRGVGGVAGQLSAEVADFGFQFGNPMQRSLQLDFRTSSHGG